MAHATHISLIKNLYPDRVKEIYSESEILKNNYCVYFLTRDDNCIVLGQGKKNRSRVIFDRDDRTTNHYKACVVRLHTLYGGVEPESFRRYIIDCGENQVEAKTIEKRLHAEISWKKVEKIPGDIVEKLFKAVPPDPTTNLVLRIALCSYYDMLSDIKKWQAQGIISNDVYNNIALALKLPLK